MARPKNAVPSYLHHKPTGQACIKLTLPGGGRKTVYLGRYGTPESRAEYARQIQAAGLNPPASVDPVPTPDITIAEVLVRFMVHAESHYRHPDGRPTSALWVLKMVAKPLTELFAHLPAREFGPSALKILRARMIDLGWCRKTVNQSVTYVRSIFKWAVSEEFLPAEVLVRLGTVSGLQRGRTNATDPEPVGPVSEEHINIVLPLVPRGVRGLIQFQRYTGARPGEVVNITMGDIDRAGPVWVYSPVHHKGAWRGKARSIAIGPKCQELLRLYAPDRTDGPVFTTAKGTAYTTSGYRQAVEAACVRAEIPVWTPNQIRHTVATDVRQRFGLEGAQVTLGHSKADVTQVYAERDHALAARVASEIG